MSRNLGQDSETAQDQDIQILSEKIATAEERFKVKDREWEKERERVCVCVWERESYVVKERKCVCVFVCVWKREGEREEEKFERHNILRESICEISEQIANLQSFSPQN